ncbi:MAG: sialate O-acetylesterase, partial [Brevundimonas sp.]
MSRTARRLSVILGVAAAALTSSVASAQAPTLADLFSDHAVLQRDRPISIWGRGKPGARVTVALGDSRVAASVDGDGRWRAELPARPAGGPFALTVTDDGGASDAAEDVMVGDVWLCSGQSNMELPVSRALNAPAVIGASADDGLRLLSVVKDYDPDPQSDFRNPVAWAPAAPDSVAEFSAACFFFAQDLRRDHDVPMGLINASWGGSRIEAWMSRDALVELGAGEGLAALDRLADDPLAAQRLWGEQWQAWWRQRAGDAPWSPDDAGDWRPVAALTPWESWGMPELAAYNGMVWYRVDVDLTAQQAGAANRLSLGAIDEADQTWVNGVAVGASGSGERVYDLPEG